MTEICKNIEAIREKIRIVQTDAGRETPVRLMAVTKFVDADRINEAIDLGGIREIGENRPQELCEKYDKLHLDGVKVHMIGSLQTNKVKYIIDKVDMIHSLDSERLAAEIDRQAEKHGKVMDCLIEVNIGKEENKGGVLPEDVLPFYEAVKAYPHLRICGLMTIAPFTEDEEQQRFWFSKTKEIFDRLSKLLPAGTTPVLSMGMSDSYPAAIACGSDIVRVGSAIFGSRPPKNMNNL